METVKPKKNISAYMYFCKSIRSTGKILSVHELGELWAELKNNPSKKREVEYFNSLAAKDSERYNREISLYREQNKEIIKEKKEKEKLAVKQSKQLERLKKNERKIQEQMRELESIVQSQPIRKKRASRTQSRDDDQERDLESVLERVSMTHLRDDQERVSRSQPREDLERVSRSQLRDEQERVSRSQPRESKPQNKKELDRLNLLLQKIQNDKKPTQSHSRKQTQYLEDSSSDDYDSDEL